MSAATFRTAWTLGLLFFAAGAQPARAQLAEPKLPDPVVAAVVNGDPVFLQEVDRMILKARAGRPPQQERLAAMRAETLNQIIKQRVAETVLTRDEAYLKKADLENALDKVRAVAKGQRLTLEEFAAKKGMTMITLRHDLAWDVGWPKYVERNVAEALESYFNAHRKDFDGTEVRVSHILLRPTQPTESKEQIVERAEKLRAEIEAGKLTFEQAAEKYSVGPSRSEGGDLGFIPRRGVMVEAFSKAAFALEKGEISQPVTTSFGVHLIRATEFKPGTKLWTEAAAQMRSAAAVQLFEKVVKQEKPNATIEFTGKCPHLDPETKELILGDKTGKSETPEKSDKPEASEKAAKTEAVKKTEKAGASEKSDKE